MDALSQWSLGDLIDRVLQEHLLDECILEDEYVVIVQGSARFILDRDRAHAFLRGVVRGMSPAFRWMSSAEKRRSSSAIMGPVHVDDSGQKSGPFDAFRRHLVKKWWGRYEEAGCPFGRNVNGLMAWIRYNSRVTIN